MSDHADDRDADAREGRPWSGGAHGKASGDRTSVFEGLGNRIVRDAELRLVDKDIAADVEKLAAAAMEPCTNRWCPDCRFGEADHDEGVAQGCTRALSDLECACWMHKHEEHRRPQCRLRAALRTVCEVMEEM